LVGRKNRTAAPGAESRAKSGEGQLLLRARLDWQIAACGGVTGTPRQRAAHGLRYFCSPQHTDSAFYPIPRPKVRPHSRLSGRMPMYALAPQRLPISRSSRNWYETALRVSVPKAVHDVLQAEEGGRRALIAKWR
jgi:hypothetical protein